jgi:hypothetical protein
MAGEFVEKRTSDQPCPLFPFAKSIYLIFPLLLGLQITAKGYIVQENSPESFFPVFLL